MPQVETILALDEFDSAKPFLCELASKLEIEISDEAKERFSSDLSEITGWLVSEEDRPLGRSIRRASRR